MPDRITDMGEIVEHAENYLLNNNRIELVSFIQNDMNYPDAPLTFIWDVGHKMQRTGKYEIDKDGYPMLLQIKPLPIPEKLWEDKHPVLHVIRTAGIGAGFSLLVGIVLWLIANQKQDRVDSLQNKRLNSLSDSIKMIQKSMPKPIDTSKTHKLGLI